MCYWVTVLLFQTLGQCLVEKYAVSARKKTLCYSSHFIIMCHHSESRNLTPSNSTVFKQFKFIKKIKKKIKKFNGSDIYSSDYCWTHYSYNVLIKILAKREKSESPNLAGCLLTETRQGPRRVWDDLEDDLAAWCTARKIFILHLNTSIHSGSLKWLLYTCDISRCYRTDF